MFIFLDRCSNVIWKKIDVFVAVWSGCGWTKIPLVCQSAISVSYFGVDPVASHHSAQSRGFVAAARSYCRERTARDQSNQFLLFWHNPSTMLYEVGVVFLIEKTKQVFACVVREIATFHSDFEK